MGQSRSSADARPPAKAGLLAAVLVAGSAAAALLAAPQGGTGPTTAGPAAGSRPDPPSYEDALKKLEGLAEPLEDLQLALRMGGTLTGGMAGEAITSQVLGAPAIASAGQAGTS